jgi:hypothetical protein
MQPDTGTRAPHAEELQDQCGQAVVERSYWVGICDGSCEMDPAAPPSEFIYILHRNDQWLIWARK